MNWGYLFKSRILERGYDYYQEGKVENLEWNGNTLTAEVFGSEDYKVEISLNKNNKIDEMYCTCPYCADGNACKHMAATLYEAQNFYKIFLDESTIAYIEEKNEYDEYEDEYERYSYEDEYDYEENLRYAKTEWIEQVVALATQEEKNQFIKEVLYTLPKYKYHYVQSLSNPDKDLLPMIYREEMENKDEEGIEEFNKYVQDIIDRMVKLNRIQDCIDFMDCIILYREEYDPFLYSLISSTLETIKKDLKEKEIGSLFKYSLKYYENQINNKILNLFQSFILYICKDEKNKKIFIEELKQYFESFQSYNPNKILFYKESFIDILERSKELNIEIEEIGLVNISNPSLYLCYLEILLKNEKYEEVEELLNNPNHFFRDKIVKEEIENIQFRLYQKSGNKDYYLQYLKSNIMINSQLNQSAYQKIKNLLDEEEWIPFRMDLLASIKNITVLCDIYCEEGMLDVLIETLETCPFELVQRYEDALNPNHADWVLNQYVNYLEKETCRTRNRDVYKQWANILLHMLQIGGNDKVNYLLNKWDTLYFNRRAMMDELKVVRPFVQKEKSLTVKLVEVLGALEEANQDVSFYYHIPSQKIVSYSEYDEEEDPDEFEENMDDYISLPDQYEINEYDMMVNFIRLLDNIEYQNQLFRAINGRGAFRRFKDKIYHLGIEQQWFKYRDNAYKKIALEWCKEHNIVVL